MLLILHVLVLPARPFALLTSAAVAAPAEFAAPSAELGRQVPYSKNTQYLW
jgi:hypothetical protein